MTDPVREALTELVAAIYECGERDMLSNRTSDAILAAERALAAPVRDAERAASARWYWRESTKEWVLELEYRIGDKLSATERMTEEWLLAGKPDDAPVRDIQPDSETLAVLNAALIWRASQGSPDDEEISLADENLIRACDMYAEAHPEAEPCPAAAATRGNEVERDAARYRWLRVRVLNWCPDPRDADADPEHVDAAIDAALSERGTPE